MSINQVQPVYSDLTSHIQGINHEYEKFIQKPTRVGGTRLRKQLSLMTKTAKLMRGGILDTTKSIPSRPNKGVGKK